MAKPSRPSRLGYTIAGTAGTALLGCFLAREGWAPRTIAMVLVAVATLTIIERAEHEAT